MFFSNAGKLKVKVKSLSRVQVLETPWTTAYQAPPSMGFSRQEYWSGVPVSSPINKLCHSLLNYVIFFIFNIMKHSEYTERQSILKP